MHAIMDGITLSRLKGVWDYAPKHLRPRAVVIRLVREHSKSLIHWGQLGLEFCEYMEANPPPEETP